MHRIIAFVLVCLCFASPGRATEPWVVYEGGDGPGRGRHIVLISGDEEYRSEEALPQLGAILARRHGFRCTVLFAIDPRTGAIDPEVIDHIPGLDRLDGADLMVLFVRWRNLPPEQLRHIADYVRTGRPIVALRTATHPFKLPEDHPYHRYDWDSQVPGWEGGFGRRIVGETWVAHHGEHGKEATRGLIAPGAEDHPIARGVEDGAIFSPTDVYTVRLPLPGDSRPIVLGQVLGGLSPDAPPVEGPKNNPMMPVAWTKTYQVEGGERGRVFATTMGASQDLAFEGVRRLLVNACYWALEMEERIEATSDVRLVGQFEPTPYGFGAHRKGLRPEDFRLNASGDED